MILNLVQVRETVFTQSPKDVSMSDDVTSGLSSETKGALVLTFFLITEREEKLLNTNRSPRFL